MKNDKAFSTRGLPKNSENKPRCLYFSKALFKGLIFGGAYVRTEICVSKLIGLASSEKEIYNFCFVLLCIRGKIPITNPPGGTYVRRGDLTEGFLRHDFVGLIFGGAYFRNLTEIDFNVYKFTQLNKIHLTVKDSKCLTSMS